MPFLAKHLTKRLGSFIDNQSGGKREAAGLIAAS
jgi:hypothetical protein